MAGKINILVACVDERLHNENGYRLKPVAEKLFGFENSYPLLWPGPDDKEDRDVIVRGIKKLSGVKDIGTIAVVSHENCAGHPCSAEQHEEDTFALVKEIQKLLPGVVVKAALATFVSDDEWELEEIKV